MSRFQNYLNEDDNMKYVNLSDEPTEDTIGKINPDDPEFGDIINKIKNTVMGSSLKEFALDLLSKNGYHNASSTDINNISALIQENFKGSSEEIEELKNLEPYEISMQDGSIDSIDNIASKYSDYLNEQYFKEISKLNLQQTTSMGKGELVLGLHTQLENSKSHGDLQTTNEEIVEVKGPKGRLKGNKPDVKTVDVAIDQLNQHFDFVPSGKSIGSTTLKELIKFLDDSVIKDNQKMKKLVEIFQHFNVKPPKNSTKLLKNILQSRNKESLKSFLLALHLYCYREKDEFKYLITFGKNGKKFIIYEVRGKGIEDLYKIMQNYSMVGPWSERAQDASFQILPKI